MTTFKYYIADKLKKSFYLGVFLLLIWLVNYGLWTTEIIFVLIFIVSLVLIKLVMIPLRGFQVRNEFSKPIFTIIIFTFFFLAASLFDFIVIPNLWVEKFGLSTEGVVTDLRTTKSIRRSRYIATYEFNVNSLLITESQSVSFSLYEKLKSSPVAEIKYLSENPDISYLRDLDYLKMNTFIALVLGFGMMFLLYRDNIENAFSNTSSVS
jgi:hypothetical protein